MFHKTVILGAAFTALLAGPALADEYCTDVPRQQWLPMHEVAAKATRLGYRMHEIEREGSCYEFEGFDKNGARIKLMMNPATGEVVASPGRLPR